MAESVVVGLAEKAADSFTMKRSELCEEAADAIKEYGWVKDQMGHKDVGFCLMGAGRYAVTKDLQQRRHLDHASVVEAHLFMESRWRLVMRSALAPFIGAAAGIADYNDTCIKSKEEAVELLMEAAKYWRNLGK